MGARRLAIAAAAAAAALLLLVSAPAQAAPVVVLGHAGHSWRADDPYLLTPPVTPAPALAARRAAARPSRTVTARQVLRRLRARGTISAGTLRSLLGQLRAAEAAARRLRGTRALELGAVLANLHEIASSGQLTASRLPLLFLTLRRNVSWWSRGPLLSGGQLVEFAGSQLVWEYYGGQGIELQELGSFGRAAGLWEAGPAQYGRMRALLGELIPLASRRAGGIAWEYAFHFDGGVPPWTSAMSQGTALQALARAYRATGDRSYLAVARQALPLFSVAPPAGVLVRTPVGRRYLQYSFDAAPADAVLNGFLQSLIGLSDYARVSGDPRANALFSAGDAEARAEVPRYDTGAWSLYQPGQEDDLDYHKLVTGFLYAMCRRTHAPVYCDTAVRFDGYVKAPPTLTLLRSSVSARSGGVVRFRLSKISKVGIVVTRGSQTVFLTSAQFPYGVHSFSLPALGRPSLYGVVLSATDLAGNFSRISGNLAVGR